MLPVPNVLIFPAVGDIAPPELPVRVLTVDAPFVAMVMELIPLVMLIPVPAVSVLNAGPVVPPISSCPFVVIVKAVRGEVVVAPEMTTPLTLNVAAPVPPPATTAVPKVGSAAAP